MHLNHVYAALIESSTSRELRQGQEYLRSGYHNGAYIFIASFGTCLTSFILYVVTVIVIETYENRF